MATVDDLSLKHLRLQTFDGKHENFQVWFMNFRSYAVAHGFKSAISKDGPDTDLPLRDDSPLDTDTTVAGKQALAKKKNAAAFCALNLAMTSPQMIRMLTESQTDEWPDGLAWKVIAALHKRFKPTDTVSKIEMRRLLGKVAMTKKEDPTTLFSQIGQIENMFNVTVDDEEKIAIAIEAAPREYQSIIVSEQRQQGATLTSDHIEDVMRLHWRALYGQRTKNFLQDDGDEDNEIGLAAGDKQGSTSGKSKSSKKSGKGDGKKTYKFKGKCHHCGKVGHKAADCWIKPENKDKRPEWYKVEEHGKVAKDSGETDVEGSVEIITCAVDLPPQNMVWLDTDDEDEHNEYEELPDSVLDHEIVSDTDDEETRGDDEDLDWISLLGEEDDESVDDSLIVVSDDDEDEVDREICCAGMAKEMEFPAIQSLLTDPNVWIADTGATTHMTPFRVGMVDVKKQHDEKGITMGNNKTEKVVEVGNLPGVLHDKNGNALNRVKMQDVSVVPSGGFNLFSITKMQMSGWKLEGDKQSIRLTKNGQEIIFDIKIQTPKGVIFAAYFERTELGNAATSEEQIKMTMEQAHEKLGHIGEKAVIETAKKLGWKLTKTTMPKCAACAAGKAKQKNLPRNENGEDDREHDDEKQLRAYLDMASIKKKPDMPIPSKPQWRILVVHPKIQLKLSEFYDAKDEMPEDTCEKMALLKQHGVSITHLRLDNAGENKALQKRCQNEKWQLGIQFEFTARDTPQQNSVAEVGFATVMNRARAMMHRANIPIEIRFKLWHEACMTATLLDGLVVVDHGGRSATRYEHIWGKVPTFAKHLRVWGEAGTVEIKTKTSPKLMDKGVHCFFVGYARDHPGDCYRMFDPKTGRVRESRDVTWLKRLYYKKPPNVKELQTNPVVDAEAASNHGESRGNGRENHGQDDHGGNDGDADDNNTNNEDEPDDPMPEANVSTGNDESTAPVRNIVIPEPVETTTTRTGRTVRAPQRLIAEIGQVVLSKAEQNYYHALQALDSDADSFLDEELAMVGAGLGQGITNTKELKVMTFDEAMAQADKDAWVKSVDEEHQRMIDCGVWVPIRKEDLPPNCDIIDSTWSMKKKASGKYRARLAARGFKQREGVSYDRDDLFAPVVNELTVKIAFVMMILAGWYAPLMDVKGAFLKCGFRSQHKVAMEVPRGFEKFYPYGWLLLLLKTLYGCKQAAKMFWEFLLKLMQSMGFDRSKADPCLYFAWTQFGLILFLSYIDDMILMGNKDGVMHFREIFKGKVDVDDIGPLDEYLGAKIEFCTEQRTVKITQPVLLRSFGDEFGVGEGTSKTPAVPHSTLQPGDESSRLDAKGTFRVRSGIGKLLYLMKWSRPDISNAVRDLSRFMQEPSLAHDKAMRRLMEYCVSTKQRGLLLNLKDSGMEQPITSLRSAAVLTVTTQNSTIARVLVEFRCFSTVHLSKRKARLRTS